MEVEDIELEKIEVGEYAQRIDAEGEGISGLVESIRRVGVLVPVVVIRKGDRYMLVAGHRRVVAAGLAGCGVVPAVVRDEGGVEAKEVSFAENVFRKDLTPIEVAAAIKDCLDGGELTIEELAAGLHRSVHWVQAQVSLLSWPEDVLEVIHNGKLSVSAASNLALVDDGVYRAFLIKQAVENGASARSTAAWLQAYRAMAAVEEAVRSEPVKGDEHRTPMVPQAPCIVCSDVYRTDELSHVPVCVHCIRRIRNAASEG